MRPSSKAWPNFQNRAGGQAIADARENRAGPLRGRAAPRLRPFLARLFPVVFHLPGMARSISRYESIKKWLGPESNRRHVDFQSTALPTELPSRDQHDIARRRGVLTIRQSGCRATPKAFGVGKAVRIAACYKIPTPSGYRSEIFLARKAAGFMKSCGFFLLIFQEPGQSTTT
jgi:hypothetical protein